MRVEDTSQIQAEDWQQILCTLIDVLPECRFVLIEFSPHVRMLRALPREHEYRLKSFLSCP